MLLAASSSKNYTILIQEPGRAHAGNETPQQENRPTLYHLICSYQEERSCRLSTSSTPPGAEAVIFMISGVPEAPVLGVTQGY